MVPWPSGKARVCKTLIRQFKSGRYLQNKKPDAFASGFLFSYIRLAASDIGDASDIGLRQCYCLRAVEGRISYHFCVSRNTTAKHSCSDAVRNITERGGMDADQPFTVEFVPEAVYNVEHESFHKGVLP